MYRNYSTHHRLKGSDDEKQLYKSPEPWRIIFLIAFTGKTYGHSLEDHGVCRFAFYVASSVDSRAKARLAGFRDGIPRCICSGSRHFGSSA